MKLKALAPVLPKEPSLLILGSMPGKVSLEKQQYYGNNRNHFWPIMYALFNEQPKDTYEAKINLIKSHHIALWDTIKSCYREGSLDSNIQLETPNDIFGLLKKYPSIRLIGCNGTKAYQVLKKYILSKHEIGVDVIKLPSTSPIPGRYTKTLEGKIGDWKQILKYLS